MRHIYALKNFNRLDVVVTCRKQDQVTKGDVGNFHQDGGVTIADSYVLDSYISIASQRSIPTLPLCMWHISPTFVGLGTGVILHKLTSVAPHFCN